MGGGEGDKEGKGRGAVSRDRTTHRGEQAVIPKQRGEKGDLCLGGAVCHSGGGHVDRKGTQGATAGKTGHRGRA